MPSSSADARLFSRPLCWAWRTHVGRCGLSESVMSYPMIDAADLIASHFFKYRNRELCNRRL
jgi:hypothetical protein